MDKEVDKKVQKYSAKNEKGYYLHGWCNNYPYNQVLDYYGNTLPVKVISAPLYEKDKALIDQFWISKRNGDVCLGIMSCGHWPHYNKEDASNNSRLAEINKPHMQSIINAIDGWLSCDKEQLFPKSIVYSESDLTDVTKNIIPWNERDIDIIYYGGDDESDYYEYHKQIQLGVE